MNLNWIELSDTTSEEKVWVNMALVTSVAVTHGYTRVRFERDNTLTVKETPLEVLSAAGVPPRPSA